MAFFFRAGLIYPDVGNRRLSFLDRDDDTSEHYFIMDRSEESPEEPAPNMDNVYIERDDQKWGGFGGIERVVLACDCLTLGLCPEMAAKMGDHDKIQITFAISADNLSEIKNVLERIMRGYENQLEFRC